MKHIWDETSTISLWDDVKIADWDECWCCFIPCKNRSQSGDWNANEWDGEIWGRKKLIGLRHLTTLTLKTSQEVSAA